MRRILTLILVVLFYNASAQIILTQSDAPTIGDTIFNVVDTNTTGLTPGPTGENVVWDYSSLGNSYMDTTYFINPDIVDVNNDFPTANIAAVKQEIYMLKKGSDGILLQGVILDTLVIKMDNPLYYIKFPFTYGNTLCDTMHFIVVVPYDTTVNGFHVDSAKVEMTTTMHDTAVAYGTVILPSENFDNALMIKRVADKHKVTSAHTSFGWIEVKDTSYTDVSYDTYINGYPDAVLTLSMADDGSVKKVTYKYHEEILNDSYLSTTYIKLYPNPAKNNLNVISKNKVIINFYNSQGSLVKTTSKNKGISTINISDLESGLYILNVINGKHEKNFKISINR